MQTRPPTQEATLSRAPAATLSQRGVFWPYACLVLAMIFLQKIGLNSGDSSIGIDTILLWIGFGWLALNGVLQIVVTRLVLLTLLLAAIVVGLLLNGQPLKITSLFIILIMYTGFIFEIKVSRATASRCFEVFQNAMLFIAAIVILQQVTQYTIGHRFWLNLNTIIPKPLLITGYAYIHPYSWNSPYLEPNGIFFLEPSALSACLAIALVLEMVWFRRLARAAGYLVAMLACLAGTGPAMVALISPMLAFQLSSRMRLVVLAVGLPVVIVAMAAGLLNPLLSRSEDFSNSNSSGYARVILPLQSMATQIADPDHLLTGVGPGQSPKGHDSVQWPFSKLLFEYGLITAIAFHVFLIFSVLGAAPSRTLALGLLLVHLFFGGGFVSHLNVMELLLFCSLFTIDRDNDRFMASASSGFRQRRWSVSKAGSAPVHGDAGARLGEPAV